MSLHYLVKLRGGTVSSFTTTNLYWVAHVSAQKITEITKSSKILIVTLFTLSVFILRSYVNKVKWCINNEWAALGQRLFNVPLASCVNVHSLR